MKIYTVECEYITRGQMSISAESEVHALNRAKAGDFDEMHFEEQVGDYIVDEKTLKMVSDDYK